MLLRAGVLLWIAAVGMGADTATGAANVVGRLVHPDLTECSGIVASRIHPGICWVHNDGGNNPMLFAVDRTGATVAAFPVAVANTDWEDIAADAHGRLYLADVGDNQRTRHTVIVHRLAEPNPAASTSMLVPQRSWRLRRATPFDCEALVVDDQHGWLIAKSLGGSAVWRFTLDGPDDQDLVSAGDLPVTAPVTAADLSHDGRLLAVLHPLGLCLLDLPQGMAGPRRIIESVVTIDPVQEGCAIVADGVLIASERRTLCLVRRPAKEP